ncbi:hypothetical protein PCANC_08860 [Puccinia coronata f. sp. avenae]|uniref:SH3 domain-containing protein n=1 Tax=Puccinia coronata f. sp. avenae TaxID=200324 RepID=A0A2N5SYT6_9BASI|nr:hypothetical protein PCANC_08860 [Puccinia coronata f. sp. avenae]
MRIGNPLPTSLPLECSKAARTFKSFVSPTDGIDGLIPSHVLRSAHGFAVFTVAKAGFLMSVRAGTGVVVARLSDGRWSPPSAIGTGGMGFGGQVGAEVAEFIIVLNSKSALTQFMSAGSITLGGNASLALGPIGRNAEGSGALNSKGKLAAMYSYSKTKGAFAGISVEGSAIFERQDCNVKAYGRGATATKILSGHIDIPLWAEDLLDILAARAGSYTEYIDQRSPLESPRNTSFDNDRAEGERSFANPSYQSQNQKDYFEREPDREARPPIEPYSFGSSYSHGSSDVTAPKPQSRRSMFAVSSWRLSRSQNSTKTDPSSHSRQSSAGTHWIDNIRSESPPPSQEKWNPAPFPSKARSRRSHSNLITQQLTEISERHHHDELDDLDPHGRRSKKDEDDEIESLSSIGSDDDPPFESANDWHDSQSRDNAAHLGVDPDHQSASSKDGAKRNWFGLIEEHGLAGKTGNLRQQDGIIDDLMSLDLMGPPNPDHHIPDRPSANFARKHYSSSSSSSIKEYLKDNDARELRSNKASSIFGNLSKKRSLVNVNEVPSTAIRYKNPIFAFSSTDKLHCFDGPEGPQAVPEIPRDRDSNDFLVGTTMPSVSCTKTDLTGYLGKVVAQFDFLGDQEGDLSFKKGDVVLILEKIDQEWWLGSIGLRKGIFPVNRVSSLQQ